MTAFTTNAEAWLSNDDDMDCDRSAPFSSIYSCHSAPMNTAIHCRPDRPTTDDHQPAQSTYLIIDLTTTSRHIQSIHSFRWLSTASLRAINHRFYISMDVEVYLYMCLSEQIISRIATYTHGIMKTRIICTSLGGVV